MFRFTCCLTSHHTALPLCHLRKQAPCDHEAITTYAINSLNHPLMPATVLSQPDAHDTSLSFALAYNLLFLRFPTTHHSTFPIALCRLFASLTRVRSVDHSPLMSMHTLPLLTARQVIFSTTNVHTIYGTITYRHHASHLPFLILAANPALSRRILVKCPNTFPIMQLTLTHVTPPCCHEWHGDVALCAYGYA